MKLQTGGEERAEQMLMYYPGSLVLQVLAGPELQGMLSTVACCF